MKTPRTARKNHCGISFAFLEFGTTEECITAKKELANTKFQEKSVYVDFVGENSNAKKKANRKGKAQLNPTRLFVGNLGHGVDKKRLQEMFPKADSACIPQRSINLDNGIKCDQTGSDDETEQYNAVQTLKFIKLDHELLQDPDGCFIIEAELKVNQEATINEEKSEFVKDIEGIFSDIKTSDVVVIAGSERFHCHKNILSTRCDVFKNMLTPNTLESELNTIEVKGAPAEAVASMLKYIYKGEVSNDPEQLSVDLLNLAEIYLLDGLKEVCLKSLVDRLDVSSCISTFIMADRYMPSRGDMKEIVIKYMKCKVEEVVALEDWKKLVVNHPSLATELMRALVKGSKEKHKCQFCVISYNM